MLTDSQLRLLAETLSNVGIVFFSSLAIPFFTEEFRLLRFAVGLSFAFICWLGSLLIVKYIKP